MPLILPSLTLPSYREGYARNAAESANPQLWDSLVGAWVPSLGATGNVLRDVSGHDNHGSFTGLDPATDWVRGETGTALDFAASGEEIDCGNPRALQNVRPLTYVSTVNPRNIEGYGNLLNKRSGQFSLGVQLLIFGAFSSSGRLNFECDGNPDLRVWSPNGTVKTNEWQQLAVTWDGGELTSGVELYRNGENLVKDFTADGDSLSSDAGRNFRFGGGLNGLISSSCIYNRVLSPNEIQQLYRDPLAPFRLRERILVSSPAGGGGGLAVTGNATVTTVATGTVSQTLAISGNADSTATAAGVITATKPAAGNADSTATATATGTISAVKPVTGIATGTATAVGTIAIPGSTELAVSGNADSTSTAVGIITATNPITGNADATSTATGTVSASKPITATADATGTATGTVSQTLALSGNADATATVSGSIAITGDTSLAVTGNADATIAASGTVTQLQRMIGNAVATATAQATVVNPDVEITIRQILSVRKTSRTLSVRKIKRTLSV